MQRLHRWKRQSSDRGAYRSFDGMKNPRLGRMEIVRVLLSLWTLTLVVCVVSISSSQGCSVTLRRCNAPPLHPRLRLALRLGVNKRSVAVGHTRKIRFLLVGTCVGRLHKFLLDAGHFLSGSLRGFVR